VHRGHLVIALGICLLARAAHAQPCGDASTLRTELEAESVRVDHWTLAWRITYTALAAGELGVAASGTLGHDNAEAAVVGGVKSLIGALGQWLTPLRIDVPAPAPADDACADRTALRATAERAAHDERQAFWVSHVGGLVINLAGAAFLAQQVSWQSGLLSFATGYPIGLLAAYTMPRASWRRVREPSWTASVVADHDRRLIVMAGSF
jgi:hypothetical protein